MDAQVVCYCILLLSIAFACLSLGLLLIRMSGAVKEATVLMTIVETTLAKVNHILDELVSGFFSRGAMKTGLLSVLGFLTSIFRRKK